MGMAGEADPPVPPPNPKPKNPAPPPVPANGCEPATEDRANPEVRFALPRPRIAPPAEREVFDSECVISGPGSAIAAAAIGRAVAEGGAIDATDRSLGAPPPPNRSSLS